MGIMMGDKDSRVERRVKILWVSLRLALWGEVTSVELLDISS